MQKFNGSIVLHNFSFVTTILLK